MSQEYVPHREGCWWDYRSRKLQDYELSRMFGTDKDGKLPQHSLTNFRTDFSARESYGFNEQQDAATGQKPNVGSVCVSIVHFGFRLAFFFIPYSEHRTRDAEQRTRHGTRPRNHATL